MGKDPQEPVVRTVAEANKLAEEVIKLVEAATSLEVVSIKEQVGATNLEEEATKLVEDIIKQEAMDILTLHSQVVIHRTVLTLVVNVENRPGENDKISRWIQS